MGAVLLSTKVASSDSSLCLVWTVAGDSFKEEASGQENNNRLAWYRFLLDRSLRDQAEQRFRLQWGPLGMGEHMKALGFLKERQRE